jgi:energy-converting hydrogenase Eha subunit G
MDYAHAHLFSNHFPIIGSIITFVFLAYAIIRKRDDLIRLSLWFFVVVALLVIPVYLTGEPAEARIENLPGMTEEITERHESAALVSLIIIDAIGVASLIGIVGFKKDRKIPGWFKYSIALAAIAFIISVGITANLGGEIRHTEIRSEKTNTN